MRMWLKITVITSLVLLNAALLFLLNQKMSDSKISVDDADLVRTTPTPDFPPEPAAPGGPQGLAVAGDGTIFRFFAGSCGGEPSPAITVSTNEGATFVDVELPEEVRSILTLTAKNADDVELIAAGKDCKPQRHVTTDAGGVWKTVKGVNTWFLQPGTDDVISPRGKVDPGCTRTVSVAMVSRARVRVLCSTGVLLGSADTGRTWQRLGALQGARAGAFPTSNVGYALAPGGRCQTRSFVTQNRGVTWTPRGCLDAEPGRAMAANRDLVAAIVGDAVYVSKNGGRTWSEA